MNFIMAIAQFLWQCYSHRWYGWDSEQCGCSKIDWRSVSWALCIVCKILPVKVL